MPNNFDSNVTRPLAKVFLEKFESARVVTKSINSQLLQGRFNPSTGSTVDFKRPTDYNSIRTSDGDISASTKSSIITGKASGTVQNYFTVATEWENVEEALESDQIEQLLAPMATRIVTDLEVDLAAYMQKNCNLVVGTPGTAVASWSDVGDVYATMDSIGIPKDQPWNYVMNPFATKVLADLQNSLSAGDRLVQSAWEMSQISSKFAGMRVFTSNALKSFTSGASADRSGTLSATPDATYVTHKDTMIQSLAVTGFTASGTIKAGDAIEIADNSRNRLNLSTRETVVGGSGAAIKWRGVVTADVTLGASGEGTILVAGPAINETNGQYNTVSSALASGDVVTLLGSTAQLRQPNLFYHPQAFGIGTVKLPKLYSTDTVATTEDGFSIRVSKYADGDANVQKVRFDLLPAYATFNPFFAGQGWG